MNNLYRTFRRVAVRIPGARRIKRRLFTSGQQPSPVPFRRPSERGSAPIADIQQLRAAYNNNPIRDAPDTFVLYRIVGNDLPPRHDKGQSRKNLAFILENEPDLPGCEKRFVLNKVVDSDEERALLELLHQAKVSYIHIPFDLSEYQCTPWDIQGVPLEFSPWTTRFRHLTDDSQYQVMMRLYRHKNNMVMNNNGARNVALREGRSVAKWVLPWDGNCFVPASAWREIVAAVGAASEFPYFAVPMARIVDNLRVLAQGFRPAAQEEPQLIFRGDTTIQFDENYYYGRRPKVEMLWRLGIAGPWDDWSVAPWDLPYPDYAADAGLYARAGWVARLSSGRAHLEIAPDNADHGTADTTIRDRGFARVEAIKCLLDELDDKGQPGRADVSRTTSSLSSASIGERSDLSLASRLRDEAESALLRGPYSVADKKSLPPSGDRRDYWHPAPYYWPNPLRIPGLPYVRRDGRRVPGTVLYEPLSDRYDRTRLQRLFDDTLVLTLAWQILQRRHYGDHAARLVRTWFLGAKTAMNPHLEYAQVRWGHNGNKGSSSGIIEMKDLYYFLDAVKLLLDGGCLSENDRSGLDAWFTRYLRWLQTSSQGLEERGEAGNHGTYYDLQVAAIAAFLGERLVVRETLRDSRSRILQQTSTSGLQPWEMHRTNTAHYCCFNLQGWIYLATLAERFDEDLWSFHGDDGRGIRRAMEWLLLHIGQPWPYRQVDKFDEDRFYPIYYAYLAKYGERPATGSDDVVIPHAHQIRPVFHPHFGIMPFWQLFFAGRIGVAPQK